MSRAGWGAVLQPIFVVDDEAQIRQMLDAVLSRAGYSVHTFADAESALARLEKLRPFLVLLDLQLPGVGGMDALKFIREKAADTTVVIISGHGTVDRAVEAMKSGASDFLTKPLRMPQVLSRVEQIRENVALRDELADLRGRERKAFFDSVVQSDHPAMTSVYRTVGRVARFPNIIALITGESGTGKEVLARFLHYQSPYADGPFVAINCAAIPHDLIESELFGYQPGTFTGALAGGKEGRIARAAGGTLFLDEIAELDAQLQVKLLRFLQDRVVVPIGATQGQKITGNILTATNRDPEAMLDAETLREDLYYRINVIRLHLPPLRERPEDVVPHALAFLTDFNKAMGRRFSGIDAGANAKLAAHSWPGNIRELHNAIERAFLLADGPWINAADLVLRPEDVAGGLGSDLVRAMPLSAAMRIYVGKVLEQVDDNKSEAARLLGISRNRLKRLLVGD